MAAVEHLPHTLALQGLAMQGHEGEAGGGGHMGLSLVEELEQVVVEGVVQAEGYGGDMELECIRFYMV